LTRIFDLEYNGIVGVDMMPERSKKVLFE